ncbi:hypothetical protein V1517DRAFT_252887 [Lipomyces orientalis]|uniref:Uncharacterized protein n=1 Tax=Lipomyces orientalis TaxID=1233043 RepID=A0ACC3TYL2_9ASCO
MRIHTGEKNYVCPEKGCGARFSRQDNCMQHYRTHQAQGAKRNSLGLAAASGSLRAVTTGVASPAAIQAARRRRSSHSGVVATGRQPGPVAVVAAAAAATAKRETTHQEFRSHHHQRHSVDYTPTGGYQPTYYDPRYKVDRATPELPPLQSPQQASYKPQYSPHSPFSPLPPPALPQQSFPSQYHTLAPRQPQPSRLQYRAAQPLQYSPAQSSVPLPVMQASPPATADAAASRLDELASIATQVAV